MKTKTKILLFGGLCLLIIVPFIASFTFFWFGFLPMMGKRVAALDKKRSAETVGTITGVWQSTTAKTRYTNYEYQYVVNGETYTTEEKLGGASEGYEKKRGLKVKVCYDPSNPKESKFYYLEDNKICGQ